MPLILFLLIGAGACLWLHGVDIFVKASGSVISLVVFKFRLLVLILVII